MKVFKITLAALIASAVFTSGASAQDVDSRWKLKGNYGVDVKSGYDFEFARAYDGIVVQPYANVKITDNLTIGGWASLASEDAGREYDLSASLKNDLGTTTIGLFEVPGESSFEILSLKHQFSVSDFDFTAQAYIVADGYEDGYRLAVERTFSVGSISATPGVQYGVAPYSGEKFTSGTLYTSLPVGDTGLSLTANFYGKVDGPDEGFDANVGIGYFATFGDK